MESFNIYKNTLLKKAKITIKHFLEILNTQLKFAIPKWMKKEWVKYPIAQKIFKVLSLGPERWSWSGSKLLGTLIVFLKDFFEKVNFEKSLSETINSLLYFC